MTRRRASETFTPKPRHVRRIKAMLDDGASLQAIARALGAPPDWVTKTAESNGWKQTGSAGDRSHRKRAT